MGAKLITLFKRMQRSIGKFWGPLFDWRGGLIGADWTNGPPGAVGLLRANQHRYSFRPNCGTMACTAECNANEVLVTAYCGTIRQATKCLSENSHAELCRSPQTVPAWRSALQRRRSSAFALCESEQCHADILAKRCRVGRKAHPLPNAFGQRPRSLHSVSLRIA